MLKQGFFYFLVFGELAILGLIMAGIYAKVKKIISIYSEQSYDQNSEHFVSEADHYARIRNDIYPLHNRIAGLDGNKPGPTPWSPNA